MLAATLIMLLPVVLYLLAVWLADRYEKEPVPLLALAVIAGALVAPGLVSLAETVLGVPNSIFPIVLSQLPLVPLNLTGAVIAEVVKSLIIIILAWRLPSEFDDTVDGLVYGVVVGAGFALAEIVVYLRSLSQFAPLQIAASTLLGIAIASLNHCVFSGLFGASIGFAREAGRGAARTWVPVLGFLAAVFYHMAYLGLGRLTAEFGGVLSVLAAAVDWTGWLLLLFVIRWGWDRARYVINQTLPDEVAPGAVTSTELEILVTGPFRARVRALGEGGWARFQMLGALQQAQAELAFAKWRAGQGRGTVAESDRHRAEIRRLRERLASKRIAS